MIDQLSQAGMASTKLTYIFSSITVIFGTFTIQEWGIITGIFLGFLTFATNLYFRRKLLKLEEKKLDSLFNIKND